MVDNSRNLKIVATSDTHGNWISEEVLECDYLIHAGDFSAHGTQADFTSLVKWIKRNKSKVRKRIIVVPGNHDIFVAQHTQCCKEVLYGVDSKVHLLVHEELKVENIRFFGSPYQPTFRNWAYEATDTQRLRHWENVPKCDILITHCPPLGILDLCSDGHVGCGHIRQYTEDNKPKLHIFGHIHEGYGKVLSTTEYYNVSAVDGEYTPYQSLYTILDIKI